MRTVGIEKRNHCFLFLFLFLSLFLFTPLLLLLLPFLSFWAVNLLSLTSRRRRRRRRSKRRRRRRRGSIRRNHRQSQFLPLRPYKRGYNRRNRNRNGSGGGKCRRSLSTTTTITSTTRRQRICRVVCGERGRRVGQVGRVGIGVKGGAVVVDVAVVGRGGETRAGGFVVGVMGRVIVVPPGLMCCCCCCRGG